MTLKYLKSFQYIQYFDWNIFCMTNIHNKTYFCIKMSSPTSGIWNTHTHRQRHTDTH